MKFKVFDLTYKYESNQVIRLEQESEISKLSQRIKKPFMRKGQKIWTFNDLEKKKRHQISERMIKNEYGIVVINE